MQNLPRAQCGQITTEIMIGVLEKGLNRDVKVKC